MARAAARIRALRADLRDLAIANYISGTEERPDVALELDGAGHNEMGSQQVLLRTVHGTKVSDLHHTQAVLRGASAEADRTAAARDGVRRTIAATYTRRAGATRDEAAYGAELYAAEQRVADTRRTATVVGTDLPLTVLDAYVHAARAVAAEAPECAIPWWALAGIGRVESGHGTSGDSRVRADGSLTQPILGVPLTGAGGTAAIADTDGGTLDGDPSVDRAVGPMQFIPSTWFRWARDGNGDGGADVQNLYDAALGAAAYLCASGPKTSDQALRAGYFSYNHSPVYVELVLAEAHGYAAAVQLPG